MNPENDLETKQNTAIDFQATREHAKDGYANAQSVVKFIDTKTGVMTGLLTVVTAAPLAWLQWFWGLDPNKAAGLHTICNTHAASSEILFNGVIIGMVCGVVGIVCSVHGLMARDPKRRYQGFLGTIKRIWHLIRGKYEAKHDKPIMTVLFPLYAPDHKDAAIKRFDLVKKGFSQRQVLEEYHVQFEQIGRILHKKIRCNQLAVSCFECQVIIYAAAGLLAYIVFRLGR